MNKNVLIIFVLAISLVLISGCTSMPSGKKDAKTVLLDSIIKSKSITSSESAYDATINAGGMAIRMQTNMWVRGNDTRADITGSILGIPLIGRFYTIPAGSISCMQTKTENVTEWTCEKGSGDSVTGLAKPLSLGEGNEGAILELINKGVLVIQPEVTENTITGRKCDTVNMLINVTKLSEAEDLSDSEMIQTAIQMKDSNVTDISLVECLDQITGYPLYFKMSTKAAMLAGSAQEVSFEMTSTKYVPNAVIADSIFVLPAEIKSSEAATKETNSKNYWNGSWPVALKDWTISASSGATFLVENAADSESNLILVNMTVKINSTEITGNFIPSEYELVQGEQKTYTIPEIKCIAGSNYELTDVVLVYDEVDGIKGQWFIGDRAIVGTCLN